MITRSVLRDPGRRMHRGPRGRRGRLSRRSDCITAGFQSAPDEHRQRIRTGLHLPALADAGKILRRKRAGRGRGIRFQWRMAAPTSFSRTAPADDARQERAALRESLTRNDGGMRFTDVTDKAGVSGLARDRRRGRGLRQRWPRRFVRRRSGRRISCFAIAATAGSMTRRKPQASTTPNSASPGRGSITTTTACSICSSSTTCSGRPTGTRRAAMRRAASGSTVTRDVFQGVATALPQSGRSDVRGCLDACGAPGAPREKYECSGRRLRPRRSARPFVTNDAVPNFLFRNKGDGTFAETALLGGVSVTDSGRPSSSMGVDVQDYTTTAGKIFFSPRSPASLSALPQRGRRHPVRSST